MTSIPQIDELLRLAREWIVEAPHDEHCFTNDPNPDACRCVCGKDSLIDAIDDAFIGTEIASASPPVVHAAEPVAWGDAGMVGKVPPEIWLAYEKRAADYAAMHGNGSAALKAGILRLTLEAWLSGSQIAPEVTDSKIEDVAEIIWNDCFGRMGGAWDRADKASVSAVQIRATARAALTAALAHPGLPHFPTLDEARKAVDDAVAHPDKGGEKNG